MLYIMRHGKTEWNSLHKLQGRTDIPLNDEGRLMALNLWSGKYEKENNNYYVNVYNVMQFNSM